MLSFLGRGIYDRDKSDVILLCNLRSSSVRIFVMHSEFSEDTKLLLSLWIDVIYANLVYP